MERLVRTVRVAYRRRDKRELPEVYWKKRLVEEDVAIQRLAMLQSAEEDVPVGGLRDEYPVDVVQRVAAIKSGYVKMDTLGGLNLFK